MAATGAFSANGDALAIHSELVRIFIEPAQRGVIIFERAREMSFRREAIVDRNDQASAILCHCLQKRIELSGEAGDVSAAMNVQKCRTPFRARSRIDNHQAQVRRAQWTGYVPFKWLRRRRRQRRHRRPFASGDESFAGEGLSGEWEFLDFVKQLRIDHGIGGRPRCRRNRLAGDGGAPQLTRDAEPNSRSQTAANKITPRELIHRKFSFLKLKRTSRTFLPDSR